MTSRRRSRQVAVGGVKIGGNAPVSIQSMTKCRTADVGKAVSEIKRLETAGCEIIRVAVKDAADAAAIKQIKRKIRIPLVCDIHFNYRLALGSIKNGADKIRLNPGNIADKNEVAQVVRAAKKARIPVRIGVNSGSVNGTGDRESGIGDKGPGKGKKRKTSDLLVEAVRRYIKIFEGLDFHDIIVSLKASGVADTVDAYRKIAGLCDYPLHLGVTAAGPYNSGIVKSSIGIGSLLLDGIGDTIRVSLTADPLEEVIAAKRILSALNLRRFGPDIISCPTCGRCQVDLAKIVKNVERSCTVNRLPFTGQSLTIALMGCEVNGPGEAREADIGVAFGKETGLLFRKGKIVKKINVKNAIKEITKQL